MKKRLPSNRSHRFSPPCGAAFLLAAHSVFAIDFDFGDAPPPYPVTLVESGARHASASALSLGAARNIEADGSPHPQALDPAEADDGVTGPVQWPKRTLVTLQVTASADCKLDAWVDWAADGHWEGGAGDAYDRVALAWPLKAGVNSLVLFVPASAEEGVTFARFRVSPHGGLATTGLAVAGEVEDYPLLITAAPVSGAGLQAPVLQVVTTTASTAIRWQGDPTYSSQLQQSGNLRDWATLDLPRQEAAGMNEAMIPAEFLTGARRFFRLVRRPLVSTPIPLPSAPTSDGLPHSFTAQTLVINGLARQYRLHLPHNWTPARQWPLMVLCPGHGQSAEDFWGKREEMRLGLGNGNAPDGSSDADANDGWIMCFAEATSGDSSYRWFVYDNPATYTGTFTPSNQPWIDDYAFIKALTGTLLASGLNIDPARVYAAGFSNGGSMCHYMASKPDHPFAAFAIVDSGVQLPSHYKAEEFDPPRVIYQHVPLAASPRPVLINNQLDSFAWPYEGRTDFDGPWFDGAVSIGVKGAVARWTVGNGIGGTATVAPPTPTSLPEDFVFTVPPVTHSATQSWSIAPANWSTALATSRNDVRPDPGWPDTLATQPGWTAELAALFGYGRMPPIPVALRNAFPHTIIPDPSAPTARVRALAGTWTRDVWRSTPGDPTNEVVLVTISDGGHNWPEADSPWNASVEVFRFFESH